MKLLKVLFVLMAVVLCISCDGDLRNIKVHGKVVNSVTKDPIQNQVVKITSWVSDTKIWESKPMLKIVSTDMDGNYLVLFEKGEAVDIEIQAGKYKTYDTSFTLDRSDNKVDIELVKVE